MLRLRVMSAILLQRFYARLVPIKPIRLDEPHQRYVDDPEHYDEQGRYLWWGS